MPLSSLIKKSLLGIKKRPPKRLDRMVQEIHEEVFAKTDCAACAACCRTISPILYRHDIVRLARGLKMKLEQFAAEYLEIDSDDDYVFKCMPCRFLGSDNRCSVYDDRPTACREYPHTDRRRFHQLIDLSIKNAEVCPAVEKIMVRLAAALDTEK
jgi:uncharacterized protein